MMVEYHKIDTAFKRDERGCIIVGKFTRPEFEYLKDNEWYWTEKVDGTNIRVQWDGRGNFTFAGKTDRADIPKPLLARLQNIFADADVNDYVEATFDGAVCFYGEGYGNKIQKVGKLYKPDGVDFILFDVKVGDFWLQPDDVADVARHLGIQSVPIVRVGTLTEALNFVDGGFTSSLATSVPAEGLVLRPLVRLTNNQGQRIITKIKHRDFERLTR